jgi:flagellar hook-associated protein 3 FlgL
MRISTSMIFAAGVADINRQMADTVKLQQQIAAKKRIINPSDDPVAAAQALQVQQAKDTNDQYATNIKYANSALGLESGYLSNVNDVFGRLKELVVQAGDGTLTPSQRSGIAVELRARFDGLLAIANSKDASGQYIFSGYMGDTTPFTGTVDTGVKYQGDDGQRQLQISASHLIATSDSGQEVFGRIPNGNGTFSATYGSNLALPPPFPLPAPPLPPNIGTGSVGGTTVTDPAVWKAPTSGSYSIQFSVSGGVTTYQIYDGATPLLATPGAYTSGQSIELQKTTAPAVDFGASVTVTGTPANGDTFVVSPSTSQSLFATLANLIHAVEGTGTTAADVARYQTDVKNAGIDLENARVNIVQVDAALGGRMNEVETVSNINSSVDLQYQQTLSNLQDLDMVKALTDLTSKQTQLDAAQKSFVSTSKLSLFNYL